MNNNIEFETIKVKMPELRIWCEDTELFPSLTELRLLLLFLSDPYKRFEPDELISRLQLTSRASLTTLVHNLRERLGHRYIVTVPGWGYTFAREKK